MERVYVLLSIALGSLVGQQLPDLARPREAPAQPLPFNHKLHASKGVPCATCHPMPDPGDFATIVKPPVCMGCHSSIKTDSPHIQKLTAAFKEGRKLDWSPVYRIPEWVSFSHKKHLSVSGVTCESCHGGVKEREALRREKDISMGGCMDCHRALKASNDCVLCHDQR